MGNKRGEDYLQQISMEMKRLVELQERSPQDKLYDQAEQNVQKDETKERKQKQEGMKFAAQVTGGQVYGKMGSLVADLADPYKTDLEKKQTLAIAAGRTAGTIVGAGVGATLGAAAGLASAPLAGGQAGIGAMKGAQMGASAVQPLLDAAEALVRASNKMEIAAQRATAGAIDAQFGNAVEAGIFSPEEAATMARETMGAVGEAKRKREEFRKIIYKQVGEGSTVEGLQKLEKVKDDIEKNPDAYMPAIKVGGTD